MVKKMTSKSSKYTTIALLGLALVSLIATFSFAGATSTDAALTATPDGSNIFRVTGTGFDADANVTLTLVANGTTYYNFTEALTSDADGNFTAIVIVPTYITGATYNLTATTDNASGYTEYTVPDLTGPTGATGATGSTGATGDAGENGAVGADGKDADQTLTLAAIGIGLVGLAVGFYAVIKKP
jgi:hypothetical protein